MKTRHISSSNPERTKEVLCNGCVTPVEAYRALVVDPKTLKPRKVYQSNHTKPVSLHATWQYLKDGDFIFVVKRPKRHSKLEPAVMTYHEGQFYPHNEDSIKEKWGTLSEEVSAWLMDLVYDEGQQAKESFLPAGCGWDGKTTEVLIKKKKRLTLTLSRLPDEVRDRFIEDAMSSPWQGLLEWNSAKPMPKQIKNTTLDFHRDKCNKECTVSWLIWHEGNWSEYVTYCQQTGQWKSTSERSKLNDAKGSSVQIPNTATKAMKIFHHPYNTREQTPTGLAWLLFKDSRPEPSKHPKRHKRKVNA